MKEQQRSLWYIFAQIMVVSSILFGTGTHNPAMTLSKVYVDFKTTFYLTINLFYHGVGFNIYYIPFACCFLIKIAVAFKCFVSAISIHFVLFG